jgi:hypothetical protein
MHYSLHSFVAGVLNRERVGTFERIVWRACRGNAFLRQAEIQEPLEDPTTVIPSWLCVTISPLKQGQLCNKDTQFLLATGRAHPGTLIGWTVWDVPGSPRTLGVLSARDTESVMGCPNVSNDNGSPWTT